jgi:hypothetical protein
VRSKVQTVSPKKAAQMLEANTRNRPLSKPVVKAFAEAMRRGDWMVTHQGIAFDINGVLIDGQHRLAAIVEADVPVAVTVFTEVPEGTFDVLDTGKRRKAADVLAMDGEKSTTMLAAMIRAVWLYETRRDLTWSGGGAAITNHQIMETLAAHPSLREHVGPGEHLASATGMIKSAAGTSSFLVAEANPGRDLSEWRDGLIDGVGLAKTDPRLMFRKLMFSMARKQAGQGMRRRDTREHIGLYLTAFNAWNTGASLTQLRFPAREPVPDVTGPQ